MCTSPVIHASEAWLAGRGAPKDYWQVLANLLQGIRSLFKSSWDLNHCNIYLRLEFHLQDANIARLYYRKRYTGVHTVIHTRLHHARK
ncbi:hypothetical protein CY34DRAFT_675717 [Suillus luteus UH-Slu-Lm8-n1]|uniref:Uncharacterized protein n=1 Tax=Suillus luteus UH-Slu-Lm8-n1 TaxID=930992 RepID=A0A0D0APT1_9AGAM|nr:hypothetical protein CY34DRAFT_675717 [Suillus luteus UH-Slu-Lm8-n1]